MSESTDGERVRNRPRDLLSVAASMVDDEDARRNIAGAMAALDGDPDQGGPAEGQYQRRIAEFHDTLEAESDSDYLTVFANRFDGEDLPVPADTPHEAESQLAEVIAERNRLFWGSFLGEEVGEVQSALNDGEPPESFRKEVADVVIVAFGIADVFDFSMARAFHEKQDRNEDKPIEQGDGTGKLPNQGREGWREGGSGE